MKLFISYRSLDSAKVDTIVEGLSSLKHEDATSRYKPWQDKTGIPAAKDWWEAIVDAIIDCDVFVFNISEEALKSDVCRAELSYARKRNRPVIPVVLEGEFSLNTRTGKQEISYWSAIPSELNDLRAQFLFYEGASFFDKFERAIAEFAREPQKWRDMPAPRPADPREGSETSHDGIALYDEACDYAGRLEFTTAEKLFQKLVNRSDPDFGAVAFEWIELLRQYEKLLALDAKTSTRFRLKSAWEEYKKLFPKEFLEGIFDPKGFGERFMLELVITSNPTFNDSVPHDSISNTTLDIIKSPSLTRRRPRSHNVMPAPFAWVDIVGGDVILTGDGYVPREGQTINVSPFKMAKYPVTNGQYAKFIESNGYREARWWTEAGWALREKEKWEEPRLWRDKKWNGDKYPVVGVSWYECVAFCLWLSEVTPEEIMLPTEDQWQQAAQGTTGYAYPWGDTWDSERCNSSIARDWRSNKTSEVTDYQNGASPFGVLDMAGNIWEWTVTDYDTGDKDISAKAKYRVLRGGAWASINTVDLQTTYRNRFFPHVRDNHTGFRIVRLI